MLFRQSFINVYLTISAAFLCSLSITGLEGAESSLGKNGEGAKVCVIGIGSLRIPVMEKFSEEGVLPNISSLLEKSAYYKHISNPYLFKTHTGWITIANGASPGVHGVNDYKYPVGRGKDELFEQTLMGGRSNAPFIWEAAEEAGKDVALICWPDSWPPRLKRGVQIAGPGLGVNSSFKLTKDKLTKGPDYMLSLCSDDLVEVDLDATSIPMNYSSAEIQVIRPSVFPIQFSDGAIPSLVLNIDGKAVEVSPGEWSPNIVQTFLTDQGDRLGAYRIKLLEVNQETGKAQIYRTHIAGFDSWEKPDGLLETIFEATGVIPFSQMVFLGKVGKIRGMDATTQLEYLEFCDDWHAAVVTWVLKNKPWDLFMTELTTIDWLEHSATDRRKLEERHSEPENEADLAYAKTLYKSTDRVVGEILKNLPKDTTVILVSDHGFTQTKVKNVRIASIVERILVDNNYLVKNGKEIDWEKTIAYPAKKGFIRFASLEKKTEKAIRDIKSLLMGYKRQGEPVFESVFEWSEVNPYGVFGEPEYDIVFTVYPEYLAYHGNTLSIKDKGLNSLRALFAISGPGIKQDYEIQSRVSLLNVCPTIAKVMGIDPPASTEAAPVWEVFLRKKKRIARLR